MKKTIIGSLLLLQASAQASIINFDCSRNGNIHSKIVETHKMGDIASSQFHSLLSQFEHLGIPVSNKSNAEFKQDILNVTVNILPASHSIEGSGDSEMRQEAAYYKGCIVVPAGGQLILMENESWFNDSLKVSASFSAEYQKTVSGDGYAKEKLPDNDFVIGAGFNAKM